MAKKIELLHTTYDENGNIESQEVVHPLTSPDCIIMENGKTLDEVMGDGIATPTLTHEGTSFKVGVGDSNIEVVDGDVAGMTLKGQSYQNILPKPTTLIMETDEKEFKINDKIDSNIIIDDNIAEIATVKGKTIVNAVQEESGSEYTVLGEDLSGQSIVHVKETPTLDGSTLVNLILGKSVENSHYTDYTIAKIDKTKTYLIKFNSTKNIVQVGFIVNNTTWNVSKDSGLDILDGYVILKPNENLDITKLRVVTNNSTGSYVLKTMLFEYQEGMENWDIPYFEGEKYFEANIKGVTLQGQTLVNTIQEPCKDDCVVLGAEDGIEISAETGGHGTIEDTVQGGINGAVLEGQTLVNIFKSFTNYTYMASEKGVKWLISGSAPLTETLNNDELTMTLTGVGSKVVRIDDVSMIKPNTKYMVKINYTTSFGWEIYFGWLNNSTIYTQIASMKSNEYAIFTTPSDLSTWVGLWFGILGDLQTGDTIKISKPVLIEYQDGMENWDIPYFEGMQSVKMPVLSTIGKNLFGICEFKKGSIEGFPNTNVTITNDSISLGEIGASVIVKLKEKPNTKYTISFTVNNTSTMTLREWNDRTQTTDANGEVIWRYGSYNPNTNNGLYKLENVQIEEGSTVTPYEPYQSSTVTTEKNLFDGILTPDYLTDSTGQPSGLSHGIEKSYYTPSYIPIQANEKFRLKATSNGSASVGDGRVYFYDKDYNYLNIYIKSLESYVDVFSMDVINTVPNNSNIAYMRVRFFEGLGVQANSVQINKVYELRGIGDVKDELDLQTGKLTQRIGEIVLDGTTYTFNQTPAEVIGDNVVGGWSGIYGINAPKKTSLSISSDIPTRIYTSDGNPYEDKEYFMVGINTMILSLSKTRLNGKTIAQYLQSNPITVQYELETPIIKTIDLQVTDQDGNTIPHIQTQPNVTHITASSYYLIPTVTIDNNLAYDTIIKPSTLYTVRFNHDTVNADNPLTVDLGGTVQTVTSTEFTITTPSELTHNQLVFSGKNNVVSEVQVIEGDVVGTQYPFFEGMNDVKFSDSQFIARGKNLIHVSKGYGTTSDYNGLTVTRNGADQTIIINGTCTLDNTSCELAPFYREFKKGERYAFSCKLISGTADRILFRVNDEQWKGNISCGLKATNSNIYETCIKTFYSDETYNRSSIRVDSGATFNNAVFKVMLEKIPVSGDYTPQYEPYRGVEVQQDVDSIPLTSDMFEQGGLVSDPLVIGMSLQQVVKGNGNNTTRIRSKSLISVKPNCKYILNGGLTGWGLGYDKNGGYVATINNIETFTTTSNTYYITPILRISDNSNITPSDLDSMNLILQEVPQEIVLRGIGDVKDELDLTRGEYIQRIGEIVLDGSDDEIWYPSGLNQDLINAGHTNIVFYYNQQNNGTIPNLKISPYDSMGNIICDKLQSIIHKDQLDTDFKDCSSICGGSTATEIRIAIPVDNTEAQKDSATCKAWLKANPIKVQYELETPIIHKVNLTNTKVIQSYATETHYETITPSDSLIPNITIPSTLNYDVAIKPSTEYTIRANTSDNLTIDLGGATGTLLNGKVTLTTPATLTHNEVKFSGTGKVKELIVVEGNEIKDNVPFFNGMKNVEMGGIKLVNVARYKSHANGVSVNANKTTITFDDDGGVGTTAWGQYLFHDELLKPNTMYTIFMNVIKNTSTNTVPVKIQLGNGAERYTNIKQGFTGNFVEKIVTSSDISERTLALFFRRGQAGEQVVIQNPMIIEGDWTHLDEIPFIESEMIIEQPIIRSQGKNLLDLESKPFTIASAGTTFTKSGNTYTVTTTLANSTPYDYIRRVWTVNNDKWLRDVAGKKLTLSVSSISCTNSKSMACIQLRIECMDGTKYFPGIHNGGKTVTFNMPANVKDLQMQIMTNNTGTVLTEDAVLTISNIRLELGDTATSYEPYKHQTLYSNRVIGYEDGCYYTWDTGTKASAESIASVMSDVEGLNVAYITHASSNFSFYDKDGVYLSGSMFLSTATDFDRFGFIKIPENAKYMKMACGNQNSSAAKDYHLKATVTGELPLRSLPNGVCDTLNLVTGEYVQRVGEMVLNGSEVWGLNNTNSKTTCYHLAQGHNSQLLSNMKFNTNSMLCNRYAQITQGAANLSNNEGIFALPSYNAIYINSNIMSTNGSNDFKQYLSQNPITVQYQLEIPIVRKLEFTTKGNYSQSNLATDCEWGASPTTANNTLTTRYRTKSTSSLPIVYNAHLFSNDFPVRYFNVDAHQDCEYISNMEYGQYVNVRRDKLEADTIEAFSKWIQQNPIEIGYITWQQTSESYSNIHKPIFFNNVNVQFLPYNLDIQPQLTFQARTRNSYVLDMAKSNTLYTVKAFSNPHDFYIDGKSFSKGTNGCITTPTLTNRLLVTGSSDVKELMIIEGDVTGKNLPYFKGILSSYHDVDEIEVYSVNKNLFDMSKVKPFEGRGTYWWNTIVKENEVVSVRIGDINNGQFGAYIKLDVRPNSVYTLYIEMEKDGEPYNGQIYGYENDDLWGNGTFTGYANTQYHISTSQNAKYITIGFNYGKDFPIGTTLVSKNMRLYLGEESPVYISHAHSTTLIEMPTRLETVKVVRPIMENGAINTGTGASYDDGDALVRNVRTKDYLPVQPGETIKFYNNGQGRAVNIHYYDINKQFIKYEFYDGTSTRPTVPKDCYFVRMYCGKSACSDITLTRQAYKPIQLNSLPNGVRDEIIMKPNSNKAQLVQRVGKVVLDGSEDIGIDSTVMTSDYTLNEISTYFRVNPTPFTLQKAPASYSGQPNMLCDSLVATSRQESQQTIPNSICVYNDGFGMRPKNDVNNALSLRTHLQENPITVYYELATPIIHEIQLKGYPHVYENGTVTLNTDISHKTLVSYNVNQEQLISNQNETIIRHDQQIDDLYYYIEMYLEEIYQMELFRMKLELSL